MHKRRIVTKTGITFHGRILARSAGLLWEVFPFPGISAQEPGYIKRRRIRAHDYSHIAKQRKRIGGRENGRQKQGTC